MTPLVKLVVKIHLDFDRASLRLTTDWVKNRLALFHETTLKSLLNQTDEAFDILVLCGMRNAVTTRSYNWNPRCTPVWDNGRQYFTETLPSQKFDYVAILRLDSDDLLHKLAIVDVRDSLRLTRRREVLVFRRNLRWDRNNNLIGFHYRKAPPFFVHVLPKSIYAHWESLVQANYVIHGRSGARLPDTVELPMHRVCVVKHEENISDIRRSRHFKEFTPEDISLLTGKDPWEEKDAVLTNNAADMGRILEEFGVAL